MHRITLSAQALAAAMNAELYRRGVPAFVRVDAVVRAPAGGGAGGGDWTFSIERSPVPMHDDTVAARYAEALFGHQRQVEEVADWAAERFAVAWDETPCEAIFIPSRVHGAPAPRPDAPVPAEHGSAGD